MSTFFGGLALFIVTGLITALVSRRRLRVYVPTLYGHSMLSDQGSLVQLEIHNASFSRLEEEVVVSFKGRLKYSLVAATRNDVSLDAGVLRIPRLAAGANVDVVVLAEGSDFTISEISHAGSKEANARISTEKAYRSKPTDALGGITLLALTIIVTACLSSFATQELHRNIFDIVLPAGDKEKKQTRLEAQGWGGVSNFFEPQVADISSAYPGDRFPVENLNAYRDGDHLNIECDVVNLTAHVLSATIRVIGKQAEGAAGRDLWSDVIDAGNSQHVKLQLNSPARDQQQKVLVDVTLDAPEVHGSFIQLFHSILIK